MHDVNAAEGRSAFPPVVTPEEWQRARDALLVKEKSATRPLDALAAEGRQTERSDTQGHCRQGVEGCE
jgi:predicted dithiol-disulfide oxidoreductase (DUF899 family)